MALQKFFQAPWRQTVAVLEIELHEFGHAQKRLKTRIRQLWSTDHHFAELRGIFQRTKSHICEFPTLHQAQPPHVLGLRDESNLIIMHTILGKSVDPRTRRS